MKLVKGEFVIYTQITTYTSIYIIYIIIQYIYMIYAFMVSKGYPTIGQSYITFFEVAQQITLPQYLRNS